jgi:translocation and assembly module TamB
MRWLKRGLFAALALLLLVTIGVAFVYWLLTAERGTQWLAGRLLAAAPELSVARVRGSLLDGVVLENLRWRSERDELEIERLELVWDAPALLIRVVSFERAAATRVAYRRLPGYTNRGEPIDLEWPIRIALGEVDSISLTIGERSLAFTDVRFDAAVAGNRLTLDDVSLRAGEAELAGRVAMGMRDVDLDVALDWSAPLADVPGRGHLALRGTWPMLNVRHELTTPFAAATEGRLDFGSDAPAAELTTEWRDLAWPGVTAVASPSGSVTLAGTLERYRYDATGTLVAAGREATFAIAGAAERLELAVERLELTPRLATGAAAGTLRAQGRASVTARETELDVTADGFDPQWLDARFAGRLGGTTTLRAALAPTVEAELGDLDLDGELRGYPVALRGAAAYVAPRHFSLDALRLESAGNRLLLAGSIEPERLDVAIEAELANLDLVAPGLQGELHGAVTLAGTLKAPRARGELAATQLTTARGSVERIVVRGELGLAPAAPADLSVVATGIAALAVDIERVEAVVGGTMGVHTASVTARAADWQATLGATGGLADDGAWHGTVEQIEIAERVLGPWRLERSADAMLARDTAVLTTTCLVHVSRARWCTELDIRGTPLDRVVVSGQNFDLAALRPLLPPALSLEGIYQLSAALFDPLGEPRGALAVTGETTRAQVTFGEQQAFATELTQARAGLTLLDGRLELRANVASPSGGKAELTAAIADLRAGDSPISGALQAEWSDLRFLALLVPQLEEAVGAVGVDLRAGGTIDAPTVEGRATLTGGRIAVPRFGLVVEAIEGAATSPDGRSLTLTASGRAGDGMLTVTGTTALDPANGWPTRLALRGDAVPIVQRTDITLLATPDLTVDIALPRVTVTGSVLVPRATIRIETLPAQAVRPSTDAVVHGLAGPTETAQPLLVNTSVELRLGDDVRYSGLNLDTTVAGGLRLATEPNRSAVATGTLRLAGTYDAYGQKLALERGELLFNGPLDNPGLDVSAVRTIDTVRAGVELSGTLREPTTRVFSEPPMSEADALSYLLFGRPATSAADGFESEQASTLQAAALSLGLQQALPVVQRIGSTLGLDELSVQSTATDAGALMAGKYLSPRLYVRYSYGLFNRIGGLLLRFKVNERLSLETRSGDQQSMDLLYTVEKE